MGLVNSTGESLGKAKYYRRLLRRRVAATDSDFQYGTPAGYAVSARRRDHESRDNYGCGALRWSDYNPYWVRVLVDAGRLSGAGCVDLCREYEYLYCTTFRGDADLLLLLAWL